MQRIEKGMSANALFDILQKKMKEAIKHQFYTQVWEIYGEAYMAHKLNAITGYQYDRLWDMAYPIMAGVVLVPVEKK